MEEIINSVRFNIYDFITKRNMKNKSIPISTICDIQDVLNEYVDDLKQQKSNKITIKKMSTIEKTLTLSGVQKFNSVKIKLRNEYSKQKITNSPEKIESIDENFKSNQIIFSRKFQEWGKYDDNDRRYYLHMIFRFYLNEYHKILVRNNLVIEYPSYQAILDHMYPNGCKNGFPPEFISFLNNRADNEFKINSLPVPVKYCGKNVTYDNNFEDDPEVSSFRSNIYKTFLIWNEHIKNGICFYPDYLLKGNKNNEIIKESYCENLRNNEMKVFSHKVEYVHDSIFDAILNKEPSIKNLYLKYNTHNFTSKGEQLKERLGFFVLNRKKFYCFKGYIEHFFNRSDSKTDVFLDFNNFCNPNFVYSPSEYNRDILLFFHELVYMFHVYSSRDKMNMNSLRECILSLS